MADVDATKGFAVAAPSDMHCVEGGIRHYGPAPVLDLAGGIDKHHGQERIAAGFRIVRTLEHRQREPHVEGAGDVPCPYRGRTRDRFAGGTSLVGLAGVQLNGAGQHRKSGALGPGSPQSLFKLADDVRRAQPAARKLVERGDNERRHRKPAEHSRRPVLRQRPARLRPRRGRANDQRCDETKADPQQQATCGCCTHQPRSREKSERGRHVIDPLNQSPARVVAGTDTLR